MTRATLLQVIDRPTALGPAEVRELEQLAQAFPYCQTAHLLLAKAAHDQGTMLAGQRLRRAATYAADRTLLRHLIEQVEPAVVEEPVVLHAAIEPAEAQVAAESAVEIEAEAPTASLVAEPKVVAVPGLTDVVIVAEPERVISLVAAPPSPLVAPVTILEAVALGEVPADLTVEAATETTEIKPEAITPPNADIEEVPVLIDQEGADIPVVEVEPNILPAAVIEIEDDLPAQAPAIRPPVEVGEARFEFGLAEKPPLTRPAYELPGLVDEWAAAAVTLSMGSLEPVANPSETKAKITARPIGALTPAAFTGDASVGYAFGESSRLGFSMQLLNLLASNAESSILATGLMAETLPPAVSLPPPGAFFEPDPLLLEHWATHCPPAPVLPSSLDLINNFLRRQPRLTRAGMLPPAPSAQTDLSVRSTRAEPDLASESLARILVRQGKTARAIEIYEKLMVKQPEKKAYFAAQIQQLQPLA